MAGYKVEICGVNTAKLPLLKEDEKEMLMKRIKSCLLYTSGGITTETWLCKETALPDKRWQQYIQSADRKSCTTFICSAESACEETCRYNRQHSDSKLLTEEIMN